MHNPASVQESDTHKLLWDFDIQTDHLISARRPDFIIINKKRELRNCGLCCPDWPLNKIERKWKEGQLLWPCLGIFKNLWYMKMTIIPIVISAFGTVTKWLLPSLENLEIGGRVETIQTTTLLRRVRILSRVPETWGDFLSLKFQWNTIS